MGMGMMGPPRRMAAAAANLRRPPASATGGETIDNATKTSRTEATIAENFCPEERTRLADFTNMITLKCFADKLK